MELKVQCGDTIAIPNGCKAIVKDGSVVFEKETKEEAKTQDFKDGDVLTSLRDNKIVFIFKEDELKQKYNENGYYVCHTANYYIDVPTKGSPFFCGHRNEVRLATEEEKQFLFNKMKEQGLRWNAEEKRVEKIRWRAEKGKDYFIIDNRGNIVEYEETGDCIDENSHEFGNYFRTEEQAEEAAKRMKEVLRKYHEEIGE